MPKAKAVSSIKTTSIRDPKLSKIVAKLAAVAVKAAKSAKDKAKSKIESTIITPADPMFTFYVNRLDNLEKEHSLSSGGMDRGDRLSTGMLVTDIILSGGISPYGMIGIAGPEASSKSTWETHLLGSALKEQMFANYHDPEGSLDPDYSSKILRVKSLSEVFGRKNKDGKWDVLPRARYYDDNTLERFFNFNKDFLMSLPDKAYLPEEDKWYYVFKPDRDGIKEKIASMGLKINKGLYQQTKRYYCETAKRGAQAIIFCDSWPALLSEDQDKEDDGEKRSKAMAFNARKFSEYYPQIIGKLRRKSVILAAVNQIRVNPMAYGNPNYEPGGAAHKFYSSCRLQVFAKTIPHDQKKPLEEEPSAWDNGTDVYAYKYFKNTKNKMATPYLDGWARVWVRDSQGQGRGYCYVWDQYQYYLGTGRINGKRNKFKIVGVKGIPVDYVWTWASFKKYILADNKEQRGISAQSTGIPKYFDMRAAAFAELKTGEGMKLYNINSASKSKKTVEDLEE